MSAPTSALNVVELAVGFADIAGYTGLSHQLDPTELAAMLARFEATTGDVIAAAGANVAKRIGDAVMFVTNAPGVACALALELIEACTRAAAAEAARRARGRRGDRAPGRLLRPDGEPRGAARRVGRGRAPRSPTPRLHGRLARVRAGYGFAPAGKFQLPGFDEPVEVFQLLR